MKDLKNEVQCIKHFDDNLKAVFSLFFFSPQLSLDAEDLANFTGGNISALGDLKPAMCAASRQRAMEILHANFNMLAQHLENVAPDQRHHRNDECQGLLIALTGLQFLKMLMFILNTSDVIKSVLLYFQFNFIMMIEVIPMVERAFIDLDNLKGGKGKRMFKFAEEVPSTRLYQGVQINQHCRVTQAKTQKG